MLAGTKVWLRAAAVCNRSVEISAQCLGVAFERHGMFMATELQILFYGSVEEARELPLDLRSAISMARFCWTFVPHGQRFRRISKTHWIGAFSSIQRCLVVGPMAVRRKEVSGIGSVEINCFGSCSCCLVS